MSCNCHGSSGHHSGGCSEHHSTNESNLGCGCSNSSPCGEVPYYENTPTCAEDCVRTQQVIKISQVFRTTSAFAMPGCGLAIWVGFDGISDAVEGAYMWSPFYGFLKIRSIDTASQQIELENTCPENTCSIQAAVGTPIPQCTKFIVTPTPCGTTTGGGVPTLYPYLNAGFTAPAVGNCIDVTLTTVNTLAVGKLVSLNNGIYRVSAISSATLITICNDGAGLTPGSVVNFEDANGNLVVPVVLIDTNPCTNPTVLSGKMLVCKNGVTQPLAGLLNNQIPVYDSVSGEVNLRTLGIPTLDCTTLTSNITLDPALPFGTPYIVEVDDTTLFAMGLTVVLGSRTYTVGTVVDGTHMYIIPLDVVSAIENYLAGSTICTADCCTQLDTRLTVVEALSLGVVHAWSGVDTVPFDNLTVGAPTLTSPMASLSIVNNLTVPISFLVRARGYVVAGLQAANAVGDVGLLNSKLQLGYGLAAAPAFNDVDPHHNYLESYTGKGTLAGNAYDTYNLAGLKTEIIAVPAGSTLYARSQIVFTQTSQSHAAVQTGIYGEANIEVIPFL